MLMIPLKAVSGYTRERMIADINVTEKSFGDKQLYKELKFSVQDREKIGLIGRNGIGKSTLFGILAGLDKDFSGDITYRRGSVVIATRQEHHGFEETSVMEYILGDLPEYSQLKKILDTYPDIMGDDMRKIETYTNALTRFDDLGYYTIENSIETELEKFQIPKELFGGPLKNLSGGQKRLVEVVKIMHANAHLALIDEPTNHMDFVAKEQFVNWFKAAQEAIIVITHDRDVLHEVDKIVEIKDGRAFIFPGNYDAYLKQNATNTVSGMHTFEVTQRQIVNLKAKLTEYRRLKERARDPGTIQRFKTLETKTRAELDQLSAIEKPSFWIDRNSIENLAPKIEAGYEKYKAKNINIRGMQEKDGTAKRLLIKADGVGIGYGETPLFEGLTFQLREGERLELRGRNGAGKTTLIKAILQAKDKQKSATLLEGDLFAEPSMSVGTYEQEISKKYLQTPLLEAIELLYREKGLGITTQKVMQLLSDYLFNPSQDGQLLVSQLSGGQKARLQLISMLATSPQLLILDEPTNHLDLPSIEQLETALHNFSGAVLFVSHDGYFRQAVGGTVLKVGA